MTASLDVAHPDRPRQILLVASNPAVSAQTGWPFRIEDRAREIPDTNFIVHGRSKAHAVRDGNLITGQQQYSGAAAAELLIEALGV